MGRVKWKKKRIEGTLSNACQCIVQIIMFSCIKEELLNKCTPAVKQLSSKLFECLQHF